MLLILAVIYEGETKLEGEKGSKQLILLITGYKQRDKHSECQ